MSLKSAKCSMCGSSINVDDSQEKGVCEYCGTEFVTEKVINVTNVTRVDKSTNIYYGESTDAKIKKDLNKAYKSLKMAGYDYENLKLDGDSLDPVLCKMACMLARGMTKNDPTNYDGWRLTSLIYYIAYTQNSFEWLYPENSEASKQGIDNVLKDAVKIFTTAKKTAPNDKEKAFIETLRTNIKVKYYRAQLALMTRDEKVSERVQYIKNPAPIALNYPLACALVLPFPFMMLLFIIANSSIFVMLFIVSVIVSVAIFSLMKLTEKRHKNKVQNIARENHERFVNKKAEIKSEIEQAQTLKDLEMLATKYGITKI